LSGENGSEDLLSFLKTYHSSRQKRLEERPVSIIVVRQRGIRVVPVHGSLRRTWNFVMRGRRDEGTRRDLYQSLVSEAEVCDGQGTSSLDDIRKSSRL
jgi:hypothetical protein